MLAGNSILHPGPYFIERRSQQPWPAEETMLTTGTIALAVARFGGFRIFHARGGVAGAWLMLAIVVAGALLWALVSSRRDLR